MSEGGGASHSERPRRRRADKDSSKDHPIKIPIAPSHSTFKFGFHEDRNAPRRRKMEDSHAFFYDFGNVTNQGLFAVFDGHGGKSAADWCGEHFPELLLRNLPSGDNNSIVSILEILDQTFAEVDSYLNAAHGIYSGCTAVVSLYRPEIREGKPVVVLYTANTGDSRSVLLRGERAIRLTYDHKGTDPLEQQRIKDAGGFIMNERVNGMLAVSRALGDAEMKDFISGRPYTTETMISEDDKLLILACDGLWDVCSDQEACDLIRDVDDPQKAAEMLVEYALKNDSYDNLSVLVIRFRSGDQT